MQRSLPSTKRFGASKENAPLQRERGVSGWIKILNIDVTSRPLKPGEVQRTFYNAVGVDGE